MDSETMFHNWLVDYLKGKLSRDYKDICANPDGDDNEEFKGHFPDLILKNHGMVMAIMEIETEHTISEKQAEYWKELSELSVKLMLMVPDHMKAKVTDRLWNKGIMGNVSVGSYSIKISMP